MCLMGSITNSWNAACASANLTTRENRWKKTGRFGNTDSSPVNSNLAQSRVSEIGWAWSCHLALGTPSGTKGKKKRPVKLWKRCVVNLLFNSGCWLIRAATDGARNTGLAVLAYEMAARRVHGVGWSSPTGKILKLHTVSPSCVFFKKEFLIICCWNTQNETQCSTYNVVHGKTFAGIDDQKRSSGLPLQAN